MFSHYVNPTLIGITAPHCVECRATQPDLNAVGPPLMRRGLVVLKGAEGPERVASGFTFSLLPPEDSLTRIASRCSHLLGRGVEQRNPDERTRTNEVTPR